MIPLLTRMIVPGRTTVQRPACRKRQSVAGSTIARQESAGANSPGLDTLLLPRATISKIR